MHMALVLGCFFGYFGLLMLIAWHTSRQHQGMQDFFLAGRNAPWVVVAYGMVGTSISGVTFISVPGQVAMQQMGYFQVVLGYLLGYAIIAWVLLPLYYRLRLTSIYSYLQQRYGNQGYKVGAFFFLLSRSTGSAARLYLMAIVLQYLVCDALGIPFWLTVAVVLGQILLYTGRGGMRTILWTDTLQSTCLIAAVIATVVIASDALQIDNLFVTVTESAYGQMFFWDWNAPSHFVKEFLSGALIAVTMTGLDQAQMQKNLSIRTLRQAQWNMMSYSVAIAIVTYFFLCVGALLYLYAAQHNIALPAKSDQLYPMLAFHHFGPLVGVLFMLGLTAAAYSSADDALTAMTTSVCIDLLGMQQMDEQRAARIRRWVHAGVTLGVFVLILLFKAAEQWQTGNLSVIGLVLKLAGYTYGPLLGLFAFGIMSKRQVPDGYIPYLCVAAPVLVAVVDANSKAWFNGFALGNANILLCGGLVFVGCLLISKPK